MTIQKSTPTVIVPKNSDAKCEVIDKTAIKQSATPARSARLLATSRISPVWNQLKMISAARTAKTVSMALAPQLLFDGGFQTAERIHQQIELVAQRVQFRAEKFHLAAHQPLIQLDLPQIAAEKF
jgi:hypothetical protein